jgi:hypothetical protein
MERVTQHHDLPPRQYGFDETDDEAFFGWRRADKVTSVTMLAGHGAILLPGERRHGSCATGAVAEQDVPPIRSSAVYPPARSAPVLPRRPPRSCWRSPGGTAAGGALADFNDLELF